MSSRKTMATKFKLVLGDDIRRLKNPIGDVDDLKEVSVKTFGRDLNTDEQKYYYFDSDDDRIDISDDEDLESAIEQCKKSCLKIHIENYDAKKDPFFNLNPSLKSERNTRPSTEKSKLDCKFSHLVSSGKSSIDGSINSSVIQEEENNKYVDLPIGFLNINETVSDEESEEGARDDEESKELSGESLGLSNSIPCRPVSNSITRTRKISEEQPEAFPQLDSSRGNQSKSLERGKSSVNCQDPRFHNSTVPGISEELQQQLDSEEFRDLKREWQFQVKAEKCYDKEYDRRRYSGFDKVYCKLRVASGHPEERAKLAVVESEEPKMGNDDVILCKKGSLISKSWIVKNVGCTNWPKNPRLKVQGTENKLVVPMILERLKPGDKMILTVNYHIPEYFEEEDDVHTILLSLNSKGFGNFGEKLALSYHVSDKVFDLKCQVEGKAKYLERVKIE